MSQSRAGVFMITVNLSPAKTSSGHKLVHAAGDEIMGLLESFSIPATWVIGGAAEKRMLKRLNESHVAHDIAVVSSVQGKEPSARRLLAGDLQRYTQVIRDNGLNPSSLLLSDGIPTADLDLLAKQQIAAVMTVSRPVRGGFWKQDAAPAPSELRYGVWNLPITTRCVHLQQASMSFIRSRLSGRSAGIDASRGDFVNLMIDSDDLAGDVRLLTSRLRQACMYVQSKSADGLLSIVTPRAFIGAMTRSREAQPATSILRKAASSNPKFAICG